MTITDANTSRQNEENTEQIMENTAIDTQNITNIDNTAQLDSQSESIIEVRHLGKIFGTHEVLKDIDFDVQKGDVTCIIGSSGSGNPPCFVALISLKRRLPAKSIFTAKT